MPNIKEKELNVSEYTSERSEFLGNMVTLSLKIGATGFKPDAFIPFLMDYRDFVIEEIAQHVDSLAKGSKNILLPTLVQVEARIRSLKSMEQT